MKLLVVAVSFIIFPLSAMLRESVLQAVRVYSQRLSHRLEDYGSCNQAYQIIESDNSKARECKNTVAYRFSPASSLTPSMVYYRDLEL